MTPARVALATALLVTAVVLETTVLSRLPLPGAVPDLVLLVVIALAFRWGPVPGAVIGFAGGLLLDLVPPADGTVGVWALVMCLAGFVAGLAQDLADRSALAQLLVVGGLAAATLTAYALVGAATGDPRVSGEILVRTLPFAVLYDVALTPFVVPAVSALARRVEPQSSRR